MTILKINRNDLPDVLKNSEYYRCQTEEEEEGEEECEQIFVDSQYYKVNLSDTPEDKIKTFHFWNVDKLPDHLIEYLLSHKYKGNEYKEFTNFNKISIKEKAKILRKLKYTGDYNFLKNIKIRNKVIVQCGDLKTIKELNLKLTKADLIVFANNSYIDCLEYAKEQGYEFKESLYSNASLDSIKYLHKFLPLTYKVSLAFVREGNLEGLKYAHENGCPWNERTCLNAAFRGNLECLKYAHEKGCPWDKRTCESAAYSGYLDCLKYAHEKGCPWDKYTCSNAASRGKLECLKYAHKNGCPWDERTCFRAAFKGNLECLIYAHENGCPWDERTCHEAAFNGHLECLIYAHQNSCPLDLEILIISLCEKKCYEYIDNYVKSI